MWDRICHILGDIRIRVGKGKDMPPRMDLVMYQEISSGKAGFISTVARNAASDSDQLSVLFRKCLC